MIICLSNYDAWVLVTKNLEIQLPIKSWKFQGNLNAAFFSSITLAPTSSYQYILFMPQYQSREELSQKVTPMSTWWAFQQPILWNPHFNELLKHQLGIRWENSNVLSGTPLDFYSRKVHSSVSYRSFPRGVSSPK